MKKIALFFVIATSLTLLHISSSKRKTGGEIETIQTYAAAYNNAQKTGNFTEAKKLKEDILKIIKTPKYKAYLIGKVGADHVANLLVGKAYDGKKAANEIPKKQNISLMKKYAELKKSMDKKKSKRLEKELERLKKKILIFIDGKIYKEQATKTLGKTTFEDLIYEKKYGKKKPSYYSSYSSYDTSSYDTDNDYYDDDEEESWY